MAEKNSQTPFYKKWWFWVIIAVIVIAIGGGAASSNKGAKKVGEGSAEVIESSQEDSGQTFKVGDVISLEDTQMTISSIERDWTAQYSKPGDGKEYVKINITLENTGDDKLSYYSSFWKIEDGDGALEDSSIVVGNDDNLSYGEITKGGKKSGSLVFEVPKGDSSLKVHYQPNMWTEREAIIEL